MLTLEIIPPLGNIGSKLDSQHTTRQQGLSKILAANWTASTQHVNKVCRKHWQQTGQPAHNTSTRFVENKKLTRVPPHKENDTKHNSIQPFLLAGHKKLVHLFAGKNLLFIHQKKTSLGTSLPCTTVYRSYCPIQAAKSQSFRVKILSEVLN